MSVPICSMGHACGAVSTGGCLNLDCPVKPSPYMPWPSYPAGCICPPTAEQTCGAPSCPRQPYRAPVVT